MRRALLRKGARDAGYFRTLGADYYFAYIKRRYLFSPDSPTAAELQRAEGFGRRVAERVAARRFIRQPFDPPTPFIYRFERFMANQWATTHLYSRLFRVNADRCTSCGLCRKICPTANILEDGQGRPVWGRNCLLCLYCEMKCPTEAIRSPASWPLFSPLIDCNVRRARRDPSIAHARVVHERGRTRRPESDELDLSVP